MVKQVVKVALLIICLLTQTTPLFAQKGVRTIIFNEDRNQKYMTTRIFKLEHMDATDLQPWVVGAVKRFNGESIAQRLDYAYGDEQYLVVSTGVEVMPYIVDMIQKMDRPCKIKGPNNEIVDGDGIHRFVYYANYRATDNMREALFAAVQFGISFFDPQHNMFYWKNSLSSGRNFMNFLKAVDRPVPQLQVRLNTYVLYENSFTELGIDYISWKNGPGAKLFSTAFQYLDFKSFTNLSSALNIISNSPLSNLGYGAFLVAPQFDATFLRLLKQQGRARTSVSGSLTVVNDLFADPGSGGYDNAKYRLKFTPRYESIQKDEDNNIMLDSLNNEDYFFFLSKPIISFNDNATAGAILIAGWTLQINDTVEKTNQGEPIINKQNFSSWLTIEAGTEKIIGTYEKDVYVRQQDSIPFLGDLPIVGYLFGSTSLSKAKAKIFITMQVDPIAPSMDLSRWSGRVIEASEIMEAERAGEIE
ncbi:hypothetical protein P0136_12310 [Lentisphaerota bacterium ZTH]|nr:hypothetical protein JYG24_10175 [Lentisphaerota bacterium]WET06141.1 hypothetical protein P0136_12310 [Lentisphaerota bacterium ZTH]